MRKLILWFCVFLVACSGLDNMEYNNTRKRNEKGEYIYRRSNDHFFDQEGPILQERERYPWEESFVGNFPRITKYFFACKGTTLNPVKVTFNENSEPMRHYDCSGKHGLPVRDGKEFIYPILPELLNYLQEETGKRVVITSGYRCPLHNTYADDSKDNRTSKHMIGAEVDFYVQGMEESPQQVVDLIIDFYKKRELYQGYKHYQNFKLYHGSTNVSTTPIFNKEVFIKIFKKDEGRDLDNRHHFPYVSIQVRYDPKKKMRVHYSWDQAYNHYFRW